MAVSGRGCVKVSGVAWVVRRGVRGGVCVVRKGIPIPNDGQKVVALTVFREKRALFAIIVFDKSKVANIETLQKGVKSSHCNMDNTPRMAITSRHGGWGAHVSWCTHE